MFKRTVNYKDFNGKDHAEDLYFNISTPEMMDLQFNPEVGGDLGEFVKAGIKSGDGRRLWIIFKLLIVNSYGRRSEDGAEFRKRAEWTEDFINSRAFEAFFEWLLLDSTDGAHAKEFYNAIMPERIRDAVELEDSTTTNKKKLSEMSREELQALYLERLRGDGETKVIEA